MDHVAITTTGTLLLVLGAIGLALLLVQLVALRRHLGPARHVVVAAGAGLPAPDARRPPISILKPLCGADDDLAANLETFLALDYPDYELVLGVRDTRDGAYPLARAFAMSHPRRVRLVLQQGEPGLNPKVNQLVTLARAARHDLLVVSDSNVRVARGYLTEIAALLADPEVGIVTHAIAGVGEARLGAAFDNLHMTASIGAGMVAADRVGGKPLVVGKSMALRRADLEALGGFAAAADVLAEDYWFGKAIQTQLGKRVVVARQPIYNVTTERTVGDFLARYRRWSVMHRQQIGVTVYAGELLLNPLVLVAAGVALSPAATVAAALAPACALKIAVDATAARLLRGEGTAWRHLAAIPAKDALIGLAWIYGLCARTIVWRGRRLVVGPGTVILSPPRATSAPAPAGSAARSGTGPASAAA